MSFGIKQENFEAIFTPKIILKNVTVRLPVKQSAEVEAFWVECKKTQKITKDRLYEEIIRRGMEILKKELEEENAVQ